MLLQVKHRREPWRDWEEREGRVVVFNAVVIAPGVGNGVEVTGVSVGWGTRVSRKRNRALREGSSIVEALSAQASRQCLS